MSHRAFDLEKLISSLGLLMDHCGKTSRVLIVFNAEGHPVFTFLVQSPCIKGFVLGVVVSFESLNVGIVNLGSHSVAYRVVSGNSI